MAQITNFDRETFLIHTLELKLWLFEVCIGSHSLAMFAKNFYGHAKKFYGRAAYVDDPLPKIVHIACLHCMALLRIQLDCVVLFGPFFQPQQ